MTEFVCEPLTKRHDRTSFQCGVDELDHWFQQRARQDQDRRVAAVYVLVPTAAPVQIAGFYTLSATAIALRELPESFAKKLPRYPLVPAILIGRLARDVNFPGVGQKLLIDALQRSTETRHSHRGSRCVGRRQGRPSGQFLSTVWIPSGLQQFATALSPNVGYRKTIDHHAE